MQKKLKSGIPTSVATMQIYSKVETWLIGAGTIPVVDLCAGKYMNKL
ncbi:MAG: hypothetical protein ACO1QB_11980 [Verrucomicrobiales bacterium]